MRVLDSAVGVVEVALAAVDMDLLRPAMSVATAVVSGQSTLAAEAAEAAWVVTRGGNGFGGPSAATRDVRSYGGGQRPDYSSGGGGLGSYERR